MKMFTTPGQLLANSLFRVILRDVISNLLKFTEKTSFTEKNLKQIKSLENYNVQNIRDIFASRNSMYFNLKMVWVFNPLIKYHTIFSLFEK